MGQLQVWGDGQVGTAIGCDNWNAGTVLCCDWSGGRLVVFNLADGALTPWGDGYLHPEGLSIAGDEVLITEAGGNLLTQSLLALGRANATVLASGLGALHQVIRTDDGTSALVADRSGGIIWQVDIGTGALTQFANGLSGPVGVALEASGAVLVTEQGTGSLTRVSPDGNRETVLTGLVNPFFLSWADAGRTALLVTERSPQNSVGMVHPAARVPVLEPFLRRGITEPSATLLLGNRLVVTGAGRLLALDASHGLQAQVEILAPADPMWPGSWFDVGIETGVTGYRREDVVISVEPVEAARLSDHPAADADPFRPTIRLLAGAVVTTGELVAKDAVTGAELGRAPFGVGLDGPLGDDGPSFWIDGPGGGTPPPLPALGLEYGVGDAGRLKPLGDDGAVTDRWRVAVVLVDTGDALWPTALTPTTVAPTVAAAQQTWRDVITGSGGLNAFYDQMSAGRLKVELATGGVLGPIHLGKQWKDWYDFDPKAKQWIARMAVLDSVVSQLSTARVDLSVVDCVLMVVRSAAGGQFVWPRAQDKTRNLKVWKPVPGSPAGTTVDRLLSHINMCHDQSTAVGFADAFVTAHELGHTLGLDDLYMGAGYSTDMQKRDLGALELMAHEDNLPELCARHKLLLGFLDPVSIRTYTYGADLVDTFDLHPINAGLPTGGASAAVELKVGPKVSWFFEFRQPTGGAIGDASAADLGSGKVVGYDAWTYLDPPIAADARRRIILLSDDGDGEGSVLIQNQDYESLDAENPFALSNFKLEVLSISAGVANVRVTIRNVQQPDPAIRNNPGNGDYRSPDIELRTALSDRDNAFLNRPILGIDNRIVAKVTNIGGLPAPNVTVRFKVLPFNTDDPSSARWMDLGAPVKHDIPAGAVVEFETTWVPPSNAHYCVQARIDRYTSIPGAAADEPDVDNNLAQTNYFSVESAPASPASREISMVDVHNPAEHEMEATIELRQETDRYRSYVDHRWLRLQAGQTRALRMEVESLAVSVVQAAGERTYPTGRTWLRSWFPRGANGHTSGTGAGVTVDVSTRVRTEIQLSELAGDSVFFRVLSPAGAPAPNQGTVVMQVTWDDGTEDVTSAPVESGGFARVAVRRTGGTALLRYSGAPGYAPSEPFDFRFDR